jgi:hypothetical protein
MKDNGSAFPVRSRWDSGNEAFDLEDPGMTLLDYFAGQALQGILAKVYKTKDYDGPFIFKDIANEAYICANAMLEEREKLNSGKGEKK